MYELQRRTRADRRALSAGKGGVNDEPGVGDRSALLLLRSVEASVIRELDFLFLLGLVDGAEHG